MCSAGFVGARQASCRPQYPTMRQRALVLRHSLVATNVPPVCHHRAPARHAQATVASLEAALTNLVGDITLAAGAVAYAGPFVPSYRAALQSDWRAALAAAGVPHSRGASVAGALGDPVRLRAWAGAGLPSDAVSVENAIIISKARRWPLMIDPQVPRGRWARDYGRSPQHAMRGAAAPPGVCCPGL